MLARSYLKIKQKKQKLLGKTPVFPLSVPFHHPDESFSITLMVSFCLNVKSPCSLLSKSNIAMTNSSLLLSDSTIFVIGWVIEVECNCSFNSSSLASDLSYNPKQWILNSCIYQSKHHRATHIQKEFLHTNLFSFHSHVEYLFYFQLVGTRYAAFLHS